MAGISKFIGYLFTGRFDKIAAAVRERIPSSIYHRAAGDIFELNSENYEKTKTQAQFPDGYICRFAEKDELADCSRMIGLDVGEYNRRFDNGNKCYAVFSANRPVNLNWIHKGSCFVRGMGYTHVANDNDYYIYGIMTDLSERGKGLYKNCLMELADYLFRKNAEHLIQMVEDGNTTVLHTLPKMGYKKTKRIRHLVVLGVRITSVTCLPSGHRVRKLFMFPPRDLFII